MKYVQNFEALFTPDSLRVFKPKKKEDKYKYLKNYKFKVYEYYPKPMVSSRKLLDPKRKSRFYLENVKKLNNNHKRESLLSPDSLK